MHRVGLLLCDEIASPHRGIAGDYPELFARLFADDVELVAFRADHDELPAAPEDCDGWLIGGSRRSVYDDVGWIDRLTRFTERLIGVRPVVGICFGHQLVARALGAEVARVGWSVGAVEYRTHRPEATADETLTIVASHQDQALELPAGTDLVASAPGCPIAGFANDAVLTLQGHPEFTGPLGAALVNERCAHLGPELTAAALASLEAPLDTARAAAWIESFLAGPGAHPAISATEPVRSRRPAVPCRP